MYKYNIICQCQADQLSAQAKGQGKLLICETLTNHDTCILRLFYHLIAKFVFDSLSNSSGK